MSTGFVPISPTEETVLPEGPLEDPIASPLPSGQLASAALLPTDAELLMRFLRRREEAAFEQLVSRHGPMVLGICRQVLRDPHEAEDAFQATFLILARRVRSVRRASSLAGWLYRVAYRTALRAARARQRRRETKMTTEPIGHDESFRQIEKQEMSRVLLDEMDRLPDSYRAVLALCALEGKSRSEAAELLECTEAAVKARLARGRKLLRMRLARRGVAFSLTLAAVTTVTKRAQASLSPTLIEQTVSSCASYAFRKPGWTVTQSTSQTMAKQGAHSMLLTSILRPSLVVMIIAVTATTIGVIRKDGSLAVAEGQNSGKSVLTLSPGGTNSPDAKLDFVALESTLPEQAVAQNPPQFSRPAGEGPRSNRHTTGTYEPRLTSDLELQFVASPQNTTRHTFDSEQLESMTAEHDYLQRKATALQLKAEARQMEAKAVELDRGAPESEAERLRQDARVLELRSEQKMIEAEIERVKHQATTLKKKMETARSGRAQSSSSAASNYIPTPYGAVTGSGVQQRRANSVPVHPATSARRSERVISPGATLQIRVIGTPPENPINGEFRVSASGKVHLGPDYGRVSVAGLTDEAAETEVKNRLSETLVDPRVMVELMDRVGPNQFRPFNPLSSAPQATLNAGPQQRPWIPLRGEGSKNEQDAQIRELQEEVNTLRIELKSIRSEKAAHAAKEKAADDLKAAKDDTGDELFSDPKQ